LLALSLLVAALLAACVDMPRPRFPHRQHLAELECNTPGKPACLTCNTCHVPSQPERAYKLPPASLCQSCHRNAEPELLASLAMEPPRPYGEIAIDHDRHLALPQVGGQCVTCHAGVVEPGQATLPPMDRCF
jgi:hypothetical protein